MLLRLRRCAEIIDQITWGHGAEHDPGGEASYAISFLRRFSHFAPQTERRRLGQRECHQKRVRPRAPNHLPNLSNRSVASPHVATISKTVVSPLSQLPRLVRRLPAGGAYRVARTFLDTRRPLCGPNLHASFFIRAADGTVEAFLST
jgi:hypothetical protein